MSSAIRCEIVHAGAASGEDRPPLLFVHGVRHAAWCWRPWQEELAAHGWQSAAVSLRGHGGSGGSTRGATLGAYVEDIVTAAATLPGPPVLVGHSMGGLLVQRAVQRLPARGVVLVAPAPAHSGVRFALTSSRRNPHAILPFVVGRPVNFSRADLLSGEVAAEEAAAVMARLEGESALAQFQISGPRRAPRPAQCPVLVLATPDDTVIPRREVARTAELQGTEARWYPGLAHDLMLEPGGSAALADLEDWLHTRVL